MSQSSTGPAIQFGSEASPDTAAIVTPRSNTSQPPLADSV